MWLPVLPVLCTVLLFTAQRSSADPDVGAPLDEEPGEPPEDGTASLPEDDEDAAASVLTKDAVPPLPEDAVPPLPQEDEEQCTAERYEQGLCGMPEAVHNEANELGDTASEAAFDDPALNEELAAAQLAAAGAEESIDMTTTGAEATQMDKAAEAPKQQVEAKAADAFPQDALPTMLPPDGVLDNIPPPLTTDTTTHAQQEPAMPKMEQMEGTMPPPPTTTAEPFQAGALGGTGAANVDMMAESVYRTAAPAEPRSQPSTTAQPKSELPGWVFGVNADWKGAVVSVYGITRTLSQWLGSLAGDLLQAVTNLANSDPPLNIIIAIFTMFLAALLFFRSLPSDSTTSSGRPAQPAQPVAKPQPVAVSAESTAALAALRQQVEEVQRAQQHLAAELRKSTFENGQGVERLAAEIRSFRQERSAIDEELLLSTKEILEWASDSGHVGVAASTNGLSTVGCQQSQQPRMSPRMPVPVALDTVPSFSEPMLPAHAPAERQLPEAHSAPVAPPFPSPTPEAHSAPVAPQFPSSTPEVHSAPVDPPCPSPTPEVPPVAPAHSVQAPPVPEAVEGTLLGSALQSSPTHSQPEPPEPPMQVHPPMPPEPPMPELQEKVLPPTLGPGAAAAVSPPQFDGSNFAPAAPPAAPSASLPAVPPAAPSAASLAGPPAAPEPHIEATPAEAPVAAPAPPVLNPAMGGRPAQQPIQAAANPFGARPKQQPISAAANPFGARPAQQPIQAAANPFGARPQQQPIQAASNPFGPR